MKIEKYELTKKNIYNVYLSNGEVLELNGKVITDNELLIKKDIDKWTTEAQDEIKLFQQGKLEEDKLYKWRIENK